MFKFTIRDVLLVMAIVALAILWFLERDGRVTTSERTKRTYRENESLKLQVRQLKGELIEAHSRDGGRLSMYIRCFEMVVGKALQFVGADRVVELFGKWACRFRVPDADQFHAEEQIYEVSRQQAKAHELKCKWGRK